MSYHSLTVISIFLLYHTIIEPSHLIHPIPYHKSKQYQRLIAMQSNQLLFQPEVNRDLPPHIYFTIRADEGTIPASLSDCPKSAASKTFFGKF